MNNHTPIKAILPIIAAAFIFNFSGFAKPKVEAATPKIIAMYFYADWCASCKTLDPKFQAFKETFKNEAFLYTKMDVTNLPTTYQSGLLAAGLGLKSIFDKTGVKTGFVYLIDGESKEIVDTIKRSASEEEISAKIKAALGS